MLKDESIRLLWELKRILCNPYSFLNIKKLHNFQYDQLMKCCLQLIHIVMHNEENIGRGRTKRRRRVGIFKALKSAYEQTMKKCICFAMSVADEILEIHVTSSLYEKSRSL